MVICVAEGCCKPVQIKKASLCWAHYLRLRRHGDPLSGGTGRGEAQRFFDATLAGDTDECVIWPFARDAVGYARIRHGGENIPAYRLMCERAHGPHNGIETHATHTCGKGNQGCINPKHLEWGTAFKNQQDRVEHGTSNRGEQCGTHKLTAAEVELIFARLNAGERSYLLATEYNVNRVTISDIKTGRSWAWLTGLSNPKARDRFGNLIAANDNRATVKAA